MTAPAVTLLEVAPELSCSGSSSSFTFSASAELEGSSEEEEEEEEEDEDDEVLLASLLLLLSPVGVAELEDSSSSSSVVLSAEAMLAESLLGTVSSPLALTVDVGASPPMIEPTPQPISSPLGWVCLGGSTVSYTSDPSASVMTSTTHRESKLTPSSEAMVKRVVHWAVEVLPSMVNWNCTAKHLFSMGRHRIVQQQRPLRTK